MMEMIKNAYKTRRSTVYVGVLTIIFLGCIVAKKCMKEHALLYEEDVLDMTIADRIHNDDTQCVLKEVWNRGGN